MGAGRKADEDGGRRPQITRQPVYGYRCLCEHAYMGILRKARDQGGKEFLLAVPKHKPSLIVLLTAGPTCEGTDCRQHHEALSRELLGVGDRQASVKRQGTTMNPSADRTRKLTPRQARFVQEYLKDLNGTQAAVRVGCRPSNARTQAAKWLAKAHIREALAVAQAELAERVQLTQEWVLNRLRKEAEREDGSPAARVAALKLLGQHVGLWRDKALEELQRELDDLKCLIAESHAPDGASST
jgi:phage terminase small subunit